MGENQVTKLGPHQPNPRSRPADWTDMLTHPSRVQNPIGEEAEGEETEGGDAPAQGRNQAGKQDICTKTPLTPS